MKKEVVNHVIGSLSDIIQKRYDLFEKLISLEKDNNICNSDYNSIVQLLSVLTGKENRIIDKLTSIANSTVNEGLLFDGDLYFDLALENDILLERFDSIIDIANDTCFDDYDLVSDDYDDCLDCDDSNLDYVDDSTYSIVAEKRIDLEFLVYLQQIIDSAKEEEKNDLIEFKYKFIFSRKLVNDEFEGALYNSNNLLDIPLELELEDFDKQKYEKERGIIIHDKVLELINDLLSVDSNEDNKCNQLYLNFLIKQLDFTYLKDMGLVVEYFKNSNDEDKAARLNETEKVIQDLLNDKVKEYNIEINEDCEELDADIIESIISLIKQEINLYKVVSEIPDALDKEDIFNRLRLLINLEKDTISKINVDEYTYERILDIIDDYVPLFINEFNLTYDDKNIDCMMIIKRIKSAINSVNYTEDEVDILRESSQYILKNNLLSSLVSYYNFMKESCNDNNRKDYESMYYKLWFSEYQLCNDFLITNGFGPNVIILDDNFCADFIDMSEIEYAYDKDMNLFELGLDILTEISELDSKDDVNLTYLTFLEIRLQNIYDNISDEHIYELSSECEKLEIINKNSCKILRKNSLNFKWDKTGK